MYVAPNFDVLWQRHVQNASIALLKLASYSRGLLYVTRNMGEASRNAALRSTAQHCKLPVYNLRPPLNEVNFPGVSSWYNRSYSILEVWDHDMLFTTRPITMQSSYYAPILFAFDHRFEIPYSVPISPYSLFLILANFRFIRFGHLSPPLPSPHIVPYRRNDQGQP